MSATTQTDASALSPQQIDERDLTLFGGLDKADTALDPTSRDQLRQSLAGLPDADEQKAAAINQSYAARLSGMSDEDTAQNWPVLRDHLASQIAGSPQRDVSDASLYGMIGTHLKKQHEERAMLAPAWEQMQAAAFKGDDWLTTWSGLDKAMQNAPGYDKTKGDEYRNSAKAIYDHATQAAPKIGPAVQMLADFYQHAAQSGPNEAVLGQREAAAHALAGLDDAQQRLAIRLASEKAGGGIQGDRQAGKTETPGTASALDRGIAQTAISAGRTLKRLAVASVPGGAPFANLDAPEQDLQRRIDEGFAGANDYEGGKVAKGWYHFAEMLPGLASFAVQAETGLALALASMADGASNQFKDRGVPDQEAFAMGLVAAAPMAALMKVQAGMLEGKMIPALANVLKPSAESLGSAVGKTLGAGLVNAAVLNVGQAMTDATPAVVQSVTSHFSQAVPDVNWKAELSRIGQNSVPTFFSLLPLALVGTGAAALKEGSYMRAYLAKTELMKAAGISAEDAAAIAKAPTAEDATAMLQKAWEKSAAAERTPEQAAASESVDSQHSVAGPLIKNSNPATATREADGSYTVTSPEGQPVATTQDANEAMALTADMNKQAEPPSVPGESADVGTLFRDLDATLATAPAGEKPGIMEQLKDAANESQKMGAIANIPGAEFLISAYRTAKNVLAEIRGNPKVSIARQAVNEFVSQRQIASLQISARIKGLMEAVPKARNRQGITAWLQAAGDAKQLTFWRDHSSKLTAKERYQAALDLTPAQIKIAGDIRNFYERMLGMLNKRGIMEDGVENYVTQLWERPATAAMPGSDFGGKMAANLKYAKERTFGSYFEGEQAGMIPKTTDIAHLLAVYANEAFKVVATRDLIKSLTTLKAKDSRPLAYPLGKGALADEQTSTAKDNFIRPQAREDFDTLDYRTIPNNSALAKWKWAGEHNGEPVMLQGQLALHPDVFDHINNILGKSAVKDWYQRPAGSVLAGVTKATVEGFDKFNRGVAGSMLSGVSTFHALHEVKRALGNRINVFDLPEIDPAGLNTKRATRAGLMIAGDNEAAQMFMQGFQSQTPVDRIPGLGQLNRLVTNFTFHELIPRLKMKTWEALNERNSALYADDIKARKLTQQDVDFLSARQVNARFGHLNYADIGRDPTLAHFSRMILLAPDFFESNLRNYGQVVQGLTGNKAGREPLLAFAATAVAVYSAARIINQLTDDDPHTEEPFAVVHDGRRYTMRNEVEDLYKFAKSPRAYLSGRESPMFGSMIDATKGTNWRGEKETASDAAKDFLVKAVPMSFRWVPGVHDMLEKVSPSQRARNITLWQEFLNSQGVQVSRMSPVSEAYKLAADWRKAQGDKEDTGVYPVSGYQQLRYALEDGDEEKAGKELAKLATDKDTSKVARGFRSSLFHPYAGSKEKDVEFRASLKESDRHLVESADAVRDNIWRRFTELLQSEQKQP